MPGTWRRSRASRPSSTPSTRRSPSAHPRLTVCQHRGVDIEALRAEYERTGLDVGDVDPDPFVQVERWMEEWATVAPNEPTAVVLATADADGRPVGPHRAAARASTATGCTVFTSYESRKGRHLAANPLRRAAVQLGAAAAPGAPARARAPRVPRARARRTSPPVRAAASWRPGRRTSRACSPTAPSSRPGSPRPRPASTGRTSRARRTGAATASCPTRSSCGRAGPTACTTASATSATPLTTPPAGWRIVRLSPVTGEAGRLQLVGQADGGDEAGDEVLLVRDGLGVGEVAPHRHGAGAGAGRQLELHAAVARQVHRVGAVDAAQLARDLPRGRRPPRSPAWRRAGGRRRARRGRGGCPPSRRRGPHAVAAVAVDRDRHVDVVEERRQRRRSRPGRSPPTAGASAARPAGAPRTARRRPARRPPRRSRRCPPRGSRRGTPSARTTTAARGPPRRPSWPRSSANRPIVPTTAGPCRPKVAVSTAAEAEGEEQPEPRRARRRSPSRRCRPTSR